jgi:hypothetical protein
MTIGERLHARWAQRQAARDAQTEAMRVDAAARGLRLIQAGDKLQSRDGRLYQVQRDFSLRRVQAQHVDQARNG